MNRLLSLVAAVVVLLPTFASGQGALQPLAQAETYRHRPLGGSVPCAGGCLAVIAIEMKSDGTCLARAPQLNMTVSTVTPPVARKMVWSLAPPAGVGTFKFVSPGIHIVNDPQSQITGGGFGDGAGNLSESVYHKMNLVTQEQTAHYVPVVLHLDGAGNPAICAAIDPKIVNGKANETLPTQ